MISVKEAQVRFKQLTTFNNSTDEEPSPKQVWRFRDDGVDFRAVKFAEPPEEEIGDYTGVEVSVIGKFRARRRVIRDFVRAYGKPTEKLKGVFKNSQVVIWRSPKLQKVA